MTSAGADPVRSFWVAAAAGARLERAASWLSRRSAAGGLLILAPTWSAASDFVRRHPATAAGTFGVHRSTLPQLAAELAAPRLAARGVVPLGALGGEALARRVLAGSAAALEYFAPVAMAPGFARLLARTLRELRTHRVDGGSLGRGGPAGRDLARLAAAYAGELERWSLADGAQILGLATAAVVAREHRLSGRALLLLDLSPRSPAEVELLAALAAAAPAVAATAVAGDRRGIAALEEVLGVAGERIDRRAADPPSRLERVRRHVFELDAPSLPAPPAEDASLEFFAAPGEGRECAEIARRVRDLAAAGLAFDEMAILLRSPESYQPLVEEALERAGIPAYFSRGTLRPDPAGRALLALLDTAAENLSASRFAEYLSLGQVPADGGGEPAGGAAGAAWNPALAEELPVAAVDAGAASDAMAPEDEEEAPQTDSSPIIAGTLRAPRQWERLLVDAAVMGGRERWQRRLDGLAAELAAQAAALGDEGAGRRRALLEQGERLAHLRSFALPLIERLAALPAAATWGVWLEQIGALARVALRRPQRVLQVLAELVPMEPVGPVGLEEVRQVLAERLSLLSAQPPAQRYGRVFVATPGEARGRCFATVFLPGLAEGSFPRRAAEDPLLLDAARRALAAALPDQEQRVADERGLLRIAAGAATGRLVASYPNLDLVQGRARVPSFYALDLLRAAEGTLPEVAELERRAAAASASILGWPAPVSPQAAIDDVEYDLAVLEPLLARGGAGSRGAGRYLLEVNPHLDRSLRRRWRRWQRAFNAADGLVDPGPETAALLLARRPRQRPYSPTALERYAACPYRFLLHAVHQLRPRQEAVPLERIDPLTRGRLFHEVQFALLSELAAEGLLPVGPATLAVALERSAACLARVAARYEEELAPAIPQVFAREIEGLAADLRGWLRQVATVEPDWVPVHFELSFGLGGLRPGDPASRAAPVTILDGVPLRGAIDLVEREAASGALRVTDHKTGRPPAAKALVVGGGEALQPLLYALAASELLGRPVAQARLFYCTRRGGYEERRVAVDERGLHAVAQVLGAVDHALESGFLPAAPRREACTFCDFRPVCGPGEEQRVGRKNQGRLTPLIELRKLE